LNRQSSGKNENPSVFADPATRRRENVTEDVRPLLVFFTSERSGPARRMESLLAHLARKERDRLRTTRVDVDARPELAAKFKVEVVPTLVLVKGKRAVGRIEGRASAPKIEHMLAAHLPEPPPLQPAPAAA
jgi:thioredoxin-like negative regulator of GroEL